MAEPREDKGDGWLGLGLVGRVLLVALVVVLAVLIIALRYVRMTGS